MRSKDSSKDVKKTTRLTLPDEVLKKFKGIPPHLLIRLAMMNRQQRKAWAKNAITGDVPKERVNYILSEIAKIRPMIKSEVVDG